MGKTKSKSVSRIKKAGNTPAPCGHSSCGTMCQVRYCGPTTHIRDHQIIHAARGVAHVWTAAIVAGLAIVLTGAIAYTAVQAESSTSDTSNAAVLAEVRNLNKRVDTLTATIKRLSDQCTVTSKTPDTGTGTGSTAKACLEKCMKTQADCLKSAGDNAASRAACKTDNQTCRTNCSSTGAAQ